MISGDHLHGRARRVTDSTRPSPSCPGAIIFNNNAAQRDENALTFARFLWGSCGPQHDRVEAGRLRVVSVVTVVWQMIAAACLKAGGDLLAGLSIQEGLNSVVEHALEQLSAKSLAGGELKAEC